MAAPSGTPGQQSAGLFGQLDVNAGNLYNQATGIGSTLTPYFLSNLFSPQGLGASTLNQIQTQQGQAIAGGLGAAKRTAMDEAARTGNYAAIPSITQAAGAAGETQLSNLQNQLGIQNALQKLQQQSQAASALSGLYGMDISGANALYGAANQALKNRIYASDVAHSNLSSDIGDVATVAGMAYGGVGGSPGLSSLFGGGGTVGNWDPNIPMTQGGTSWQPTWGTTDATGAPIGAGGFGTLP